MNQKWIFKTTGCFLLILVIVFTCVSPVFGETPAKTTMEFVNENIEISVVATAREGYEPFRREELRNLSVIPGGMAFGTKYKTEGLTVVGFSQSAGENPAKSAGIREKDAILACNGETLESAERLSQLVMESEGKTLYLTCRRAGKKFTAKVRPQKDPTDGNYQIGVLLQDSGAGIGTVTFILTDSLMFAGLGHGICDSDTGMLIPVQSGVIQNVTIHNVKKGKAGDPGELKGYFDPGVVGSLLGNASCGVWGIYDKLPSSAGIPVPVGLREDVREGDATILCTISEGRAKEYGIKISAINRGEAGSKCFTVTVTDPELLAVTGGIVQGMSGSPILQDGKLVGAVTHVLVNEPTVGYGIFLENMLTHLPLCRENRAAA